MSVSSLVAQQRAAIIARDQALARNIDSAYSGLWQSLAHRLNKLLADMQRAEAAANAAGIKFNGMLWVKQIRGLDMLLGAARLDVQGFAQVAQTYINAQMRPLWYEGAQNALKLMEESLGNRIGITFGQPSAQALEKLAARDYLFKNLETDTVDAIRKRLLAGLALGQGPREVAASIEQGAKLARNRALVIARTESITAYREANRNTFLQNADVVREWEWNAAVGACPFCQSMDGTLHPLDEPMDTHPQCRCVLVPRTYGYDAILASIA